MKISWLGHSCFLLEENGFRLVLDPYRENSVPGLKLGLIDADMILTSHQHADHAALECVRLRDTGLKNPFQIQCVPSFHDHHQGLHRGKNTIHLIKTASMKIVHLGDLGHLLEEEQLALLEKPDVLMIPIGGYYTISAEEARKIVSALQPRIILPMHYHGEGFGYDVLSSLEDFLCFYPESVRYSENEITVNPDTPSQIAVLDIKNTKYYIN